MHKIVGGGAKSLLSFCREFCMSPSNLPHSDVTGTIAQLFVYPVKSCAGIEVPTVRLTETGLEWDRAWMLVDAHGQFVTQRELPRMALIQPSLMATELELRAPDMPVLAVQFDAVGPLVTVQVWDDHVPAHDMGDQVAEWFTKFLDGDGDGDVGSATYRLVRFDPAHRRVASLKWTDGVPALNQFSDGFPLLVISESSLAGLNQRLLADGHSAVSMARFRPNVVLAGVGAHDEDRVSNFRVDAEPASVLLKPVKPCPRCPIPNIDPATAKSSPEVSDTLQGYRQDVRVNGAVTFGMNCVTTEGVGALLRVGQVVSAELDFG
jgi:uncharacterized protein YcbX